MHAIRQIFFQTYLRLIRGLMFGCGQKHNLWSGPVLRVAAGFAILFSLATAVVPSYAALKCQEMLASRSCADNQPHPYAVGGGNVAIPAPVLSGYEPYACWLWARRFQCVETNPIYSCDSGTEYPTVKANCNLTKAVTNSVITLNGLTYVTDATYNYACEFGGFTTTDALPAGTSCAQILPLGVVTPTASTLVAALGVDPAGAAINQNLVTSQSRNDTYVCYKDPVTSCTTSCTKLTTNAAGDKVYAPTACPTTLTDCVPAATTCNSVGPDGRCISSTANYVCQAGDVPKCLTQGNCTLQSATASGIQSNGVATTQQQDYLCSSQTLSCDKFANVSSCVSPNAWGLDQWNEKNTAGLGLGEANQAMAKLDGVSKGANTEDPYIFSGQDKRCHFAVGNFLNTLVLAVIIVAAVVASGGTAGTMLFTTPAVSVGGLSVMTASTVTVGMAAEAAVAVSAVADAVDSKAFGNDCCKDYVIAGSDAWYKFGSACTGDEVKLAVGRRKSLTYYLGEYCSKEGGWLIKQCVERSRTYCLFDDMLAMVVNEQGRGQLEQLAMADATTTTSSAEFPISAFSAEPATVPATYTGQNTGWWRKITKENNSQIWYWQYPKYCASAATQAAAYSAYEAELKAAVDQSGYQPGTTTTAQATAYLATIQPSTMTVASAVTYLNSLQPGTMPPAKALEQLKTLAAIPMFQECPSAAGRMPILTCSATNDNCEVSANVCNSGVCQTVSRMPATPSGADVSFAGQVMQVPDANWRIQDISTLHNLGDYGVSLAMGSDANFAAVSESVSAFVSAAGSCKSTGACLYRFGVTDKLANSGLGARKKISTTATFPMYSYTMSDAYPSVNYVAMNGTLNLAAYQADANRGLAAPNKIGTQRFIFHPNLTTPESLTHMGAGVLLEWAGTTIALDPNHPENDYIPLVVPTTLPAATPGWWPYVSNRVGPDGKLEQFFLKGSCDANSKWCNYSVEQNINIARHPWGSAESPRCWGFSLDQLSALDFSAMDLSKWINTLDLGSFSGDKSVTTQAAMTESTLATSQAFYNSFKTGAVINSPNAGGVALTANTDTLPLMSAADYESYLLKINVPSNWPKYFTDGGVNNNPVTNVKVSWEEGTSFVAMTLDGNGTAWGGKHDFGSRPPGTYKIRVTLDTLSNGPQALSLKIGITPDSGSAPGQAVADFATDGVSGKAQTTYTPSMMLGGASQAPDNLGSLSPATAAQFDAQGAAITVPATTP